MANSNSNGLVLDVPVQDANGSCCEACRSRGGLLQCSSCPAVFHAECVGYGSAKDVPEGDWLCWFCAQDKGQAYRHPTAHFQQREGQDIMLAVDGQAKVFCRTKVLNMAQSFFELTYLDKQGGSEIISRASPRLWQGTCDKAAWTVDEDGIHWRPNSRLYRPGEQRPTLSQHNSHAAAASPTGAISPSAVNAANGSSTGRGKLKLHFKGLRRSSTGDLLQQQQQVGVSSDRPPAGPLRLSVPPSPSRGTGGALGDPSGVLSPEGSAGGSRQASPAGLTAAAAGALESVRRRGLACIPVGEVGAGLPVVQGGASKAEFLEAMHQYWVGHAGGRVPKEISIGGNFIDPWVFWREVWAWGGPDMINEHRLWATIGHSFLPPSGATSISTRMKTYYDSAMGPMDEAVDAGVVELLRPEPNRLPSDRHLQARVVHTLTNQTSITNLQAAAAASREQSPALSLPPAAAAAAAPERSQAAAQANGDDGTGDADGMQRQQQPRKRQRQRQRQEQRPKRRRADKWSDNDEGDVILAESSSDESDDGRIPSSDQEEGRGWQQRQRQQQHRRVQEVSSSTGAGAAGSTKGSPKRLRVNMSQLREGMLAAGLDAAGCYEYLRQPTDMVVLGRIQLTPAALAIQVGDCVDFRQPSSSGGHVTGWRSGIVLATAPGSEWEGGRRLLIKPRHAAHTHTHAHHLQLHGGTPSLPPDSPAAAALAAVAAAGGPTGGSAAEAAAQKLLTPSGHLRHEVAALLPTRSGSLKLTATQSLSEGDTATPPPPAAAAAAAAAGGAGPSSQQQQGPGGGPGSAEDSDQPRWVAMVWRGDCWDPFLAPPVLIRPHYAPSTVLVAAGSSSNTAAAAAGEDSSTSPFASPQQQRGQHQQQQRQRELRVGAQVEVLRDGCWCPAQVVEVMQGGSAAAAGGAAAGGAAAAAGVVVLRSMAPPEADGSVWRCSGTHPIRPLHPRYASGCGMVACSGPDELVTLGAMRKALAPYMYSEGIHAFACLDQMRAARTQAVAW